MHRLSISLVIVVLAGTAHAQDDSAWKGPARKGSVEGERPEAGRLEVPSDRPSDSSDARPAGRIVRRATPLQGAEAGRPMAGEDDSSGLRSWEDDPRIGGRQGRLRYRIARAPYESVETPDVVTLQDGTRLEAYFMEVYGDWLVFYVKESAQSWLKEQIPRAFVADVEFDAYLERDPLEPPVIKAARKQPVPKDDILSGIFSGSQGRYTRWTISFRSEIDKFREFAEDATEYGAVELESRFDQKSAKGPYEHKVHAEGYYYLYAPGTVNNEEWVLVLSDIIQREVDYNPHKGFFSERIPDETFILHFSPRKDSFWLEWSNVGQFSWTPLVRVKFLREEEEGDAAGGRAAPPSYRSLELREADLPGRGVEDAPRPAVERRASPRRPPARLREDDRRKTTVVQADARDDSGRATLRAPTWQVGDWGPARSFWGGR